MQFIDNNLNELTHILLGMHQPAQFDAHPWTKSPLVKQACLDMPEMIKKSPGQQLVIAIIELFTQMMPPNPPRRGKRLDTRWGEFGILASQYFAPAVFGWSAPVSLREAWGRIDQSILLFVYKKPVESLSEEEKELYRLVGQEQSIAPNSTLSDWHRNGLERLMDMILRREGHLSNAQLKQAEISDEQGTEIGTKSGKTPSKQKKRVTLLVLGIFLLGLLFLGGLKSWQMYQQVRLVREDARQLRELINGSGSFLERIEAVGPMLDVMRKDFDILDNEAHPFLWLGWWLKWLPVYGGDLSNAQQLMTIADSMLSSSEMVFTAITPLISDYEASGLDPNRLAESFLQTQPQLMEAYQYMVLARIARDELSSDSLSPKVKDLVINDIDPVLNLMEEGLTIAQDLPRLLGATNEGPKTYMLLVQNNDELRPTGGFITSVGTLLIDNGKIASMKFEDSGSVDNWLHPYPAAPWQLQQYMDSPVLIFRDSNWFTDFPTAAMYAETLLSYSTSHSVDGVFAFDQQLLVEILKVTGPIKLEGYDDLVNSENIIAFMRSAKIVNLPDYDANVIYNKAFINQIADTLINKIFNGEVPLDKLLMVIWQQLNEHHILAQLDSTSVTDLLALHHWDGAVHPEKGDFLMVVDTNIGFNKTNSVVESLLFYDVDLTDLTAPISSLSVIHKNNSPEVICRQRDKSYLSRAEKFYPVTDCYWNYMRIYKGAGTKILKATPQFIPANWMVIKQDVPAQVDILDEAIAGIQAFGTLMVVPGNESRTTDFRFALPPDVIQSDSTHFTYHLLVQKQPGTLAVPITIRVHLPESAAITSLPTGAVIQENNVLLQGDLQMDLRLDIQFEKP
jgi:hypothetical protein